MRLTAAPATTSTNTRNLFARRNTVPELHEPIPKAARRYSPVGLRTTSLVKAVLQSWQSRKLRLSSATVRECVFYCLTQDCSTPHSPVLWCAFAAVECVFRALNCPCHFRKNCSLSTTLSSSQADTQPVLLHLLFTSRSQGLCVATSRPAEISTAAPPTRPFQRTLLAPRPSVKQVAVFV